MSTKGGPVFTICFPGGGSPPCPPVCYATAWPLANFWCILSFVLRPAVSRTNYCYSLKIKVLYLPLK